MSFLNLPFQGESQPVCMRGRRSFKCYIHLTAIQKIGLVSQGVIYSLTGDRCWTDLSVGFTRGAWRRLEFPSHLRYSPVGGRVCQEFKALAAWFFFFFRTEGESGSSEWGGGGGPTEVRPCNGTEHGSRWLPVSAGRFHLCSGSF